MAPVLTGRAGDLPPRPASAEALFDAMLAPNRSLAPTGFLVLMAVIAAFYVVIGTVFSLSGAWPVLGFLGLDIAAVYLAFRLSYRSGRLRERVLVTADALSVSRVLPSGHESRWSLHPFWTRVECDQPPRHESQVRLVSRGRTLVLASFLSPEERGAFAAALRGALDAARNSRG